MSIESDIKDDESHMTRVINIPQSTFNNFNGKNIRILETDFVKMSIIQRDSAGLLYIITMGCQISKIGLNQLDCFFPIKGMHITINTNQILECDIDPFKYESFEPYPVYEYKLPAIDGNTFVEMHRFAFMNILDHYDTAYYLKTYNGRVNTISVRDMRGIPISKIICVRRDVKLGMNDIPWKSDSYTAYISYEVSSIFTIRDMPSSQIRYYNDIFYIVSDWTDINKLKSEAKL